MIIGVEPPKLKEQINIAFGLGLYPIDNKGELNFDQLKKTYSGEENLSNKIIKYQEQKNKLWDYLNLLFLKKLDIIKPKIYITDLCKCYDHTEKKEMWAKCLHKCLMEEIRLINPNLIIFQGGPPYESVMRYLKSEGLIKSRPSILEKTEDYFPKLGEPDYYEEPYSKPCFGKFPFNGKNYYFFKIYHQAAFNRYLNISDRDNYIKQNNQFIEKKILKEVLNIN